MPRIKLQRCNSNGSDISVDSVNSDVEYDENTLIRHRCDDGVLYYKYTDLPFIAYKDNQGVTRCIDCHRKMIIRY